MAIFEYKYNIGARDVDSNKKITNRTILGLLENAGCLHSDDANCGLRDLEETRLSWVIIHWKVSVHRRPEYRENVTVKTWVTETRRLYTYRQYEIFDESGEKIISVNSQWVLNHLDKGIIKVPQEIIDKYGTYKETVFETGNTVEKLREPKSEPVNDYEFTVPCTYIDFNDHMNNICYLDIAYQSMPYDVYRTSSLDEFEITYHRECKYGERLHCFYYFDGEYHTSVVKNIEENKMHAIVRFKAD